METSGDEAALFSAMAAAQQEMRNAAFDRQNAHLRNRYATLGSVLETVRPVLNRHGLVLIQTVEGDGEKVGVSTAIAHRDGGIVKGTAFLPIEEMKGLNNAQAFGLAITYLRRYALLAAVGITAEEDPKEAPELPDDDGNLGRDPRKKTIPHGAAGQVPTGGPVKAGHHLSFKADQKRFMAFLGGLGLQYEDVAAYCERLGRPRPSAMDVEQRQAVAAHLRKLVADEAARYKEATGTDPSPSELAPLMATILRGGQ